MSNREEKSACDSSAFSMLQFKISGLYDDDEVSKLMSQIISELVPGILEDYQQKVSEIGGKLVTTVLNKVLSKLTVEELLALLGIGK